MISFDDAQRRFLALGRELALGAERVAVDAASGRVAAEDVVSPLDVPGFDYSAMDGYAVATAAFAGVGPFSFPVAGESRAGEMPADLVPGAVFRILTGAAIPRGADAVVMQERVVRDGDRVTFHERPRAGQHVRRRGEDVAQGAITIARGTIVQDDRAATERAIATALDGCDVLVTVGGISVGDRDWVRPAFEAASVELDFWKVAIKPGKPIALGRRGRTIVLGLPGNPASAMITYAVFGLPLLRALQGDRDPLPRPRVARLASDFTRAEPGRTELVRVGVAPGEDGIAVATPLRNQASGAASSMAEADALFVVPAEATTIAKGSLGHVFVLEELGA